MCVQRPACGPDRARPRLLPRQAVDQRDPRTQGYQAVAMWRGADQRRSPLLTHTPVPSLANGPQRDMGEYDDRLAGGLRLQILLQPAELIGAEVAEAPSLQALHVVQADEMYAVLVEAVITFRTGLGEPLEEDLAVVLKHVMLAGDVVRFKPGVLDDLLGGVELRRPGQAASADPMSLDRGTPPLTVQSTPAPAHTMHSSSPRRLWPDVSPDVPAASGGLRVLFMVVLRCRGLTVQAGPGGRIFRRPAIIPDLVRQLQPWRDASGCGAKPRRGCRSGWVRHAARSHQSPIRSRRSFASRKTELGHRAQRYSSPFRLFQRGQGVFADPPGRPKRCRRLQAPSPPGTSAHVLQPRPPMPTGRPARWFRPVSASR